MDLDISDFILSGVSSDIPEKLEKFVKIVYKDVKRDTNRRTIMCFYQDILNSHVRF